jgi:hypothetical protein
MDMTDIEIKESAVQEAASKGMDAFITLFTDRYKEVMKDGFTAENMSRLNSSQHTLLAYVILRDELLDGGFCQLIQNGYGSYIFDNPFAKAMRLWGMDDFSKFLYRAKKIYDAHRSELERERTDDEFMAMYEQFEQFDDLDDSFVENEEEITEKIARFVDEHIDNFSKIVK